jgi:16S rRNA (guanine527-N7)-methyltransferase
MGDDEVLRALAEARALGFLGPGPLEAHVASAQAFLAAIGTSTDRGRALDLGSGGGVPGLLLAAWLPHLQWTLLDVQRRRTSFLSRTVTALGWSERVAVRRAPAEEAAHDPELRARFDLVVARSFGPPARTAELAVGFLRVGGRLLVAEPPTGDPARWPSRGLATLGLEDRSKSSASVAVHAKVGATADDIPRPLRTVDRQPRW